MPKIIDLNERIREGARAELRRELDASAQPLLSKCRVGHGFDCGLTDANGKGLQAWEAIDKIIEAVFQLKVAHREQEAIDEFILKVDNLQSQVSELRDAAGV